MVVVGPQTQAASFKRPYQNCPEEISRRSSRHGRGSPDRVLSFVFTNDLQFNWPRSRLFDNLA